MAIAVAASGASSPQTVRGSNNWSEGDYRSLFARTEARLCCFAHTQIPVPVLGGSPRASRASSLVELVAVGDGGTLLTIPGQKRVLVVSHSPEDRSGV